MIICNYLYNYLYVFITLRVHTSLEIMLFICLDTSYLVILHPSGLAVRAALLDMCLY